MEKFFFFAAFPIPAIFGLYLQQLKRFLVAAVGEIEPGGADPVVFAERLGLFDHGVELEIVVPHRDKLNDKAGADLLQAGESLHDRLEGTGSPGDAVVRSIFPSKGRRGRVFTFLTLEYDDMSSLLMVFP